MITSPLITICQNALTPIITMPSPSTPITAAPTSVPTIVPRPPASEAPPRTALGPPSGPTVYQVGGGAPANTAAGVHPHPLDPNPQHHWAHTTQWLTPAPDDRRTARREG